MLLQYGSHNLIVHADGFRDPDVLVEVTPERAGWEFIHFQARRLPFDRSWSFETGEHELVLIVLSGRLTVESSWEHWEHVGARPHVFAGLPYACYLPRRTAFTVTAETDSEFAVAWVPSQQDHPPQLITPDAITTEIRGGDNVTRQINAIIPPGFDCHRLVVVEVYTPSGNWSSYPPHKHDVHRVDAAGNIIEADLEEVYYYKFDRPEGYAFQHIYTAPESPLHRAGFPIDTVLIAHTNDVVLIPEGYHPVASAPGYTTYYLNVLAGSAQSLANQDDPQHAWVKDTYQTRDPRLPLYEVKRRV